MITLFLHISHSSAGDQRRLLVPAYENPAVIPNGSNMWATLIDWGNENPNALAVIFNPNSGPGNSPVDGNYINDQGQGPLVDLLATNTPVYGYISTKQKNGLLRDLQQVQTDIDRYNNTAYWRGLDINLAGYFIDQMSNDLADVGYYQSIKDHINSIDPLALVIGNPGVSSTFNPSNQTEFTVNDYANSMDTMVVYEDFANNYVQGYIAPEWLAGRPDSAFGHIIHTVTDLQQMIELFNLATQRNTGFLYITDDILDEENPLIDPYDVLPTFSSELWDLINTPQLPTEDQSRLLVPAYGNPANVDGDIMWETLINWGNECPNVLSVIFNPFNGPGVGLVDPNYVNDQGQGPLVDLLATNTPVYGYIATGFGSRDIMDVQADIDQYNNIAYWRGLDISLAGYFIDEMSNDLADVGYYQSIHDYINLIDPLALVIGNPGLSSTINPSNQTDFTVDDYADSMDTIVVYEGSANNYIQGYIPPEWLAGRPNSAFGHIIHTATDLQQMIELFNLVKERNAGFLYITDDVLSNPYDRLPIFAVRLWELINGILFRNGFENT